MAAPRATAVVRALRAAARPAVLLAQPAPRFSTPCSLGGFWIAGSALPWRARTRVMPNHSLNADPLRRPCLPAQPPLVIIGRTGKPVRLRGRRYLER
jgi:hypothetical protein